MTGLGGRRQRRVWLLVAAVCGAVAVASGGYVVRQLGHGGLKASDTAGLLAVGLAAAAGLVAVLALRKQSQANTAAFADAGLVRGWAATLARQVEAGEGAVRRQLLGDDTRRINLAYRLHAGGARPARAPGAGRLFADGPGGPVLPDIAAYYRETRPERLVITGAAGAGKTVLALELLLALIEGRAEGDPVPVRIPLSRWDIERQTLPGLLTARLVEAYDWPPMMAAGLVRHGLVLPVLDGLEEMDPPGPGGLPDPAPRATAVVEALNAYQRGREAGPLILTCRTGHYDALTTRTEVVDAARIAIEPVHATDAWEYLAGRALDEARWRPLLDHLAAEPTGMLATVLSTPWRLGLTATVYHRDDPAELLALPDADTVDSHLLARYIPAAVRTAPNPDRYTADEVHRWLHHLTTHLDPTGTAGGNRPHPGGNSPAEATDLLLHELWPLAGRLRVVITDVLVTALAVLALLPLARYPVEQTVVAVLAAVAGGCAIPAGRPKHWDKRFWTLRKRGALVFGLAGAIGLNAGVPFLFVLVLKLVVSFGFTVSVLVAIGITLGQPLGTWVGLTTGIIGGLAFRSTRGRVFGSLTAIATGLAICILAPDLNSFAATFAITTGLFAGFTSGFVIWIAAGISREPGMGTGGRAAVESDARLGLAVGITAGFALGAWFAQPTGLLFGLAAGITAGLAFGARASRRYLVFLVCARRRLPFRLGRFLDWSARAGLLRYSGAGYQYRHRELQHWLRRNPHPSPAPAPVSSSLLGARP
ncbi:NACHT domain-containing protein [Streptomyces erythrochromogenes]|uniref:NACHT domain-containing protein n=1 Tax=Streptomyces erythrochromogenes TaxID=285574 RepID=UPI0037D78F44